MRETPKEARMEIRLEGAGSCEKHSNYLTFEQSLTFEQRVNAITAFLFFFFFWLVFMWDLSSPIRDPT